MPQAQMASFKSELQRIQKEALTAFDVLPKPILLHCSAGIDRSAPVAAFIRYPKIKNVCGAVTYKNQR